VRAQVEAHGLVDQPLDHPYGYLRPVGDAPWVSLAFALDWQKPPRQQQSATWHYVQSDQWRYDSEVTDYDVVPEGAKWATGHAMDLEAKAVRMGWMPFFPQFKESSLEVAREAEAAGATDAKAVATHVAGRLKSKDLELAVDDPDDPENWPRIWLIWRGNAIMASAKGHEFFLRHYLGTHDNSGAEENAKDKVKRG
jgi:nitrate reductase alpha subunit